LSSLVMRATTEKTSCCIATINLIEIADETSPFIIAAYYCWFSLSDWLASNEKKLWSGLGDNS